MATDQLQAECDQREKLLLRHVACLHSLNGDEGSRFAQTLVNAIARSDRLARQQAKSMSSSDCFQPPDAIHLTLRSQYQTILSSSPNFRIPTLARLPVCVFQNSTPPSLVHAKRKKRQKMPRPKQKQKEMKLSNVSKPWRSTSPVSRISRAQFPSKG